MKKALKIIIIPLIYTIFSITFTIIFSIKGYSFEKIFSIFGLFLASWVLVILRLFKIKLPIIFSIYYYIFIFLAIGLGAGFRVYDSFYFFDSILHILTGLIVPLIALYILFTISKTEKERLLIIIFIFSVSMMTAAIWEVVEFSVDNIFGMNTQHNVDLIGDGRSGVFDTMKDIICHLIGTTISTVLISCFYKKIIEKKDKLFKIE